MCVARLLGQGRIVVSADVVIFRGIPFSLAVSRCGVSIAIVYNRLQSIARNEVWRVNDISDGSSFLAFLIISVVGN